MKKWYAGFREDTNAWYIFTVDNPDDATPEASGYIAVSCGYDGKEFLLNDFPDAEDVAL